MLDNKTFPFSSDSMCSDAEDITMAFNATRVCLLLPLSTCVLFLGYRQWRQQGSVQAMSHADVVTYHNAALELMCNLVTPAYVYGCYSYVPPLMLAGWWICWLALSGEICFHLLTCVERYVAVLHPVAYRGLRGGRGVRIRNSSLGCAWLLCVVCSTTGTLNTVRVFDIQLLCVMMFSLLVVSFCSVSVLRALVRPGPGDVGHRLKRRAFVTITAITSVLWLWFIWFVTGFALELALQNNCLIMKLKAVGYWSMMPSSLVLPLLYLHRTGPLRCRRNSGREVSIP